MTIASYLEHTPVTFTGKGRKGKATASSLCSGDVALGNDKLQPQENFDKEESTT